MKQDKNKAKESSFNLRHGGEEDNFTDESKHAF
jgi:hypothetical protein